MPLPFLIAGLAGLTIASAINGSNNQGKNQEIQDRHEANLKRFENTKAKVSKSFDSLNRERRFSYDNALKFTQLFGKIVEINQCEFNTTADSLPEFNDEKLQFKPTKNAEIAATSMTSSAFSAATMTSLSMTPFAIVALPVCSIFSAINSKKLSDKINEARDEMLKEENEINKCCDYLNSLYEVSEKFHESFNKLNQIFQDHIDKIYQIIEVERRVDWRDYSQGERILIKVSDRLTQLLCEMCKVNLVSSRVGNNGMNEINTVEINRYHNKADDFTTSIHDLVY